MKHCFAAAVALAVLQAFVAFAPLSVKAQTPNSETGAASDTASGAKKGAASHSKKTAHAVNGVSSADTPPKAGQYATMAAAQAHCGGKTVVWVDKDNFHHYAGSREYGSKPGAFICE